jgi:hypothetical protein
MWLFISLSMPVINCMFSVAVAVLPVPWCQWRRCAPCCTLYTTSPHEVGLQMLCFSVNLEVMCSVIWNQAGRTWLSNWHASYRPGDIFIFVEPCWEYIRLEQISTNFILDRIPADDGAHSPSVPTPVLRSAEEERLQRGCWSGATDMMTRPHRAVTLSLSSKVWGSRTEVSIRTGGPPPWRIYIRALGSAWRY